MSKFAIELTATGYDIPTDDPEVSCVGFVVTVFLRAENEDAACEEAIGVLLASEAYDEVAACADPARARIEVTHWSELRTFEDCPVPMSGFVFFSEDDGAEAGSAVQ